MAGTLCAGVCVFGFGQAQATSKVEVHARSLGPVAPTALAAHLHLQAGNKLVVPGTTSPNNGAARLHSDNGNKITRVRARQVYKGVPVYGRSVVVSRDARGSVLKVDGQLEQNLGTELASVQPRLSGEQAQHVLQKARGQLRQTAREGEAKLYVYPQNKQTTRLIYQVSYLIGSGNNVSRPTAIIDANTGKVIKQWNGLTTGRRPRGSGTPTPVQAQGVGGNGFTGLYHYDGSDNRSHATLAVTRQGTACYMINRNVATYNLAGGQRVTLWSFGCNGRNPANWISTGDSINGAFSPIDDAHHFGQVVHDMYENWFGAPPLKNSDGSAMQLHMWVHYGSQYANAFWDGREMVFGDGAQLFYPFVSLDITGHEISHGFTEQHSGLQYTGQSGGMNEAFSDMAGEAVVYYNNGSNNFLVGEDILKPGTAALLGLNALRDMCEPSRDGQSIGNAANYYPGLDVHYSSGVYNKAFCLLAKTNGWNTKKAFEVFHDANALYWQPNATFDSGACGVEQAADARGYAEEDVVAAFDGVGVACADTAAGSSGTSGTGPLVPAHRAHGNRRGPVRPITVSARLR